jgi:hypothetical protein
MVAVGLSKELTPMRKSHSMIGLSLLLAPAQAEAHIKWFCAYDTAIPPLPILDVITSTFAAVAAGFCSLMFVAYVVDRAINATDWAGRFDDAITRYEGYSETIVRSAVGVLFLVLWDSGDTILLPELKTTNGLVPWFQLAVSASMIFPETLVLGAAGIMALYGYAVFQYGAFHMMDYPIVPGVAVYLGLATWKNPYANTLRLAVLYSSVAATMMWGAIEKFGYPYWTLPLVADYSKLTLGLGFDRFMIIAGFVEFSLAFFMVTGTALLRWSCLALLLLLVSAIPAFGRNDAIGHLLIIVGLLAMIISGQRTIQMPAFVVRAGILTQAGLLTFGYVMTITATFALYYGSQYLAGR